MTRTARSLILVFFAFLIYASASGQVRIGIKGGLSTFDIKAGDLILLDQNDAESFKLKIQDAKYGIHIGFFLQAKTDFLFFQPELLFNSNSVDYEVEDLSNGEIRILDENYQQLDIPLMVGFRAGPLRLGAGPVGHLAISSTSDLLNIDGYDQKFDGMSWGWQAGIGLDFWKLHFDFRYEGNLSNFGDHITFFGEKYQFDEKPSRLIASLGISF
jgi:hypothetical protein